MDRRVLVVGLVVVTAGCGSITGLQEGPETLTPVPVPEETATPDPMTTLPPGMTGAGVVNVEVLIDAHQSALSDQSFTFKSRLEYEGRGATTLVKVESERRYYYVNSPSSMIGNISQYADGETQYTRDFRYGLRYRRSEVTNVSTVYGNIPEQFVELYLVVDNATVAETRIDGERYYEYRVENATGPRTVDIDELRVRALIRADGFVRSVNATYVHETETGTVNVTDSFGYSRVESTTVERPGWVRAQWGRDDGTGTATATAE
jgi:hypothetical protein